MSMANNTTERVDELLRTGRYSLGQAIAQAVTEESQVDRAVFGR